MWRFLFLAAGAVCLPRETTDMATDYFLLKDVKYVTHLSCKDAGDIAASKLLMNKGIRSAVRLIDQEPINLKRFLNQYYTNVGVLLDGDCENVQGILNEASESTLFDDTHFWLVVIDNCNDTGFIEEMFQNLKLSVDADVSVALHCGRKYRLMDVFNFGFIQGNPLETRELGVWSPKRGLEISLRGFKYYSRWDFHNLTLRAVSVVRNSSMDFNESVIFEPGYTVGVAAMTKICSQLLILLKEMHHFRFNYTIVGRWIGTPERNSTKAMSNTLFWREQDISSTSVRLFSAWLDWVDPFFPSATELETKFYYTISDSGVGDYENRFLTPMSPGVWWCAAGAGALCALVLAAAAAVEGRPEPGAYGAFSVLAAGFQQDYEDGAQLPEEEEGSSQSRKLALLVVGLTSMLLYNYYTSSVVSWLLNAAAPSLNSLDGLINSDFELVFEDIGYTRQWLDNPGFYYYSGYKNEKEDELRAKKVTNAKRTLPLFQSVEDGVELMRTGRYAFHTEPYTASQVISRTFVDKELCALAGLQMIKPAAVYIMGQKNSPYKQFFVWSMMRLLERGHIKAIRTRVGGEIPPCSGHTPRSLSLGQAAPAFLLLAEFIMLSVLILAGEVMWHRYEVRKTSKQVLPLNSIHTAKISR